MHHSAVIVLPNQLCAISWDTVRVAESRLDVGSTAGSIRKAAVEKVTRPQFSIAAK